MILHYFRPPKWPPKSCKMGVHFWIPSQGGGGPPKSTPKSKVFGSVFGYLKVADFYIIILLYIRFLLHDYQIIIRLLLHYYQIIIRLVLDYYQILIRLLLDSYQILIRFLSDSYQMIIRLLLDYYQLIIRLLLDYYY